MSKVNNIKRFFPNLYKPFLNTYIKGLLESIGESDEEVATQIQNAKEQIFVATAIGQYLDVLGSNVGVERPISSTGFYVEDALYRKVIPILSYYPKQVRDTMKALLEAFFGTSNPDVFVKEINPNEVVVQLPANLSIILDDLEGTTHFHQEEGYVVDVDNVLKTIVVNFENHNNVQLSSFSNLNKLSLVSPASDNLVLAKGRIDDEGLAASVDKISAASVDAGVDIDFQCYPLDLSSSKYVSYLIYLSDVSDVVSVSTELYTDSDASIWTRTKSDLGLEAGWNIVNFDISDTPTATTGSGVTSSSVTKIRVKATFSATTDTLSGIKFSNLYSTSTSNLFSANEFAGMSFAHDGDKVEIVSHDAGSTEITLQFGMSEDLSIFSKMDKFKILNENWPGDFVYYPTGPAYAISSERADLGQTINAGDPGGLIVFTNTSEIPNSSGYLIFNWGEDNEEELVPYIEVVDGVSLIVDPSYTFLQDHSPGEVVNVCTSGAHEPNDDGTDYAIYVAATDILIDVIDDLMALLKATGVVLRFETFV